MNIRLLTKEDIPFAMEVKNLAKWNQVEQDWQAFLAFEPQGCFLAEMNNEKAGTGITIIYEKSFAWVGMILVHPDKRRMGVGKALLDKCIEYLHQAGIPCVKLDATPMGRLVYIQMGFEDEFNLQRYQGVSPIESVPFSSRYTLQTMQESDLEQIGVFDKKYFGAARPEVLNYLFKRGGQWCHYTQNDLGEITGYIMVRKGYNAYQIGPWVAADDSSAELLLLSVFRKIPGQEIFLDIPCPNESGVELIKKYEFIVQRDLIRMHLGKNVSGIPSGMYATSSAEKG